MYEDLLRLYCYKLQGWAFELELIFKCSECKPHIYSPL